MKIILKKLSPISELLIVLIIGFGLFIYSSTATFFIIYSDFTHSWIYKYTISSHLIILIYETIALLIIIYILKVREWRLSYFNLQFTFRMILIAILLILIKNFIGGVAYKILELAKVIDEPATKHVQYRMDINWIVISLFVVLNSIYEEFILVGYLFKRLEKYHPAVIIGLSTLIRLSYHTYQGWFILFSVIPMGLVFGYYYFRYKKLWPLIIAHGVMNLIIFLNMQFKWYE